MMFGWEGAAVFADELSAAVDCGIGSIQNMFGRNIVYTRRGFLDMPEAGQEATSTYKTVTQCPKNISEAGYQCVCLNARRTVKKKKELYIMVEDIDLHIIGVTDSWANDLSLKDGVVPFEWKETNIIPLFKKDSRNISDNYRPISLTSVICNLLERLNIDLMVDFHDRHIILLNPSQHGSLKARSCLTNTLCFFGRNHHFIKLRLTQMCLERLAMMVIATFTKRSR